MKLVQLIVVFGVFIFLTSSCSKWTKKMEVVRDCTGVYLKKDSKDFKVCNESKLDAYETGAKITVDYDVLAECFGLIEQPVCLMYHEYESRIEVVRVK